MRREHPSAVTRVVLADDRSRVRRALRALLAAHTGVEVIGEAADGEEVVARVERLRPDLVLMDVRMRHVDGIAATARIKARWPSVRVVAHSLAEECRDEVLAAGADAFVPKGAPIRDLLDALRASAPPPSDGTRVPEDGATL